MKKPPDAPDDEDTAATWEKFVENTRHVMGVPKEEIDRREKEWRKKRADHS